MILITIRLATKKGDAMNLPLCTSKKEGFNVYVIAFSAELIVRCTYCRDVITKGRYVVAAKFHDCTWNIITFKERPVCCEDKKIVPLVFPTEKQADESMYEFLSIMQKDKEKKIEDYYFLSVAKYFPTVEVPSYQ